MVLNAAWLLVTQQGWIWVSVVVMAGLVVTLGLLVRRLEEHPSYGHGETVLVDGTFGLYLGWVAVAACANVTAALVASGVDPGGYAAQLAAVVVLAVAAGVGVLLARRLGGRWAVAVAMAWGLLLDRLGPARRRAAVGRWSAWPRVVAAVVVLVAAPRASTHGCTTEPGRRAQRAFGRRSRAAPAATSGCRRGRGRRRTGPRARSLTPSASTPRSRRSASAASASATTAWRLSSDPGAISVMPAADRDRAGRPRRGDLHEPDLVAHGVVMVDDEADLLVELLGPVDVGHRHPDQLQLDVHADHDRCDADSPGPTYRSGPAGGSPVHGTPHRRRSRAHDGTWLLRPDTGPPTPSPDAAPSPSPRPPRTTTALAGPAHAADPRRSARRARRRCPCPTASARRASPRGPGRPSTSARSPTAASSPATCSPASVSVLLPGCRRAAAPRPLPRRPLRAGLGGRQHRDLGAERGPRLGGRRRERRRRRPTSSSPAALFLNDLVVTRRRRVGHRLAGRPAHADRADRRGPPAGAAPDVPPPHRRVADLRRHEHQRQRHPRSCPTARSCSTTAAAGGLWQVDPRDRRDHRASRCGRPRAGRRRRARDRRDARSTTCAAAGQHEVSVLELVAPARRAGPRRWRGARTDETLDVPSTATLGRRVALGGQRPLRRRLAGHGALLGHAAAGPLSPVASRDPPAARRCSPAVSRGGGLPHDERLRPVVPGTLPEPGGVDVTGR